MTGVYTIVAAGRGARPSDWASPPREPAADLPAYDPGCPFCPGNEEALPGILQEWAGPVPRESWQIRAVPNRFPILGAGEAAPVLASPAEGRQEVIVESPHHDVDLAGMSPDRAATVVAAYRDRVAHHLGGEAGVRAFLFRNRGRWAGTSLRHPHAQLAVTRWDPPEVEARERRMRRYHERTGRCLLDDLPSIEPGFDERVVVRERGLTAFVPWAPWAPLEVWIVPDSHLGPFHALDRKGTLAVALILTEVLRRYRDHAGDPSYNLLLDLPRGGEEDDPALRWMIRLIPRTTHRAGLELMTGVAVTPSEPRADAAILR